MATLGIDISKKDLSLALVFKGSISKKKFTNDKNGLKN
jgi:hypothetical protein